MSLYEILKLDKVIGSIKKIDLFLAECDKNSPDYYQAFAYRAEILHTIGKTNDALKGLYGYVLDFKYMEDASVIFICDKIIKITMEVDRLDQAKKYIEIKKDRLAVSKSNEYNKDLIRYYLKAQQFSKATQELFSLLNKDPNKEDETWVLENLLTIYFKEHQYDQYLEYCPRLEKIYQDTFHTKAFLNIQLKKLLIFWDMGNYVRVICDANRFLNENDLDAESKVTVATLLIKSYIKSKDFRKASIIESNYEEWIEQASPATVLDFAKACLDLYSQTNALVPMKHYEGIIATFEQNQKQEKQIQKKTKKAIVIPTVEEPQEVSSSPISEPMEKRHSYEVFERASDEIQTAVVSKTYEQLSDLFKMLNGLDPTVLFREVFRLTGIELSSLVSFREMYLLYYNQRYAGIHYKKERVYDKKIEYSDIEGTLNLLSMSYEREVFLNPDSTEGTKDIVTGETLSPVPYGIAFPFFKEDHVFGSLFFVSDAPFLQEDTVYEVLKLVSQMLNARLLFEIRQSELEQANKRMFFIYEHMSMGMKEVMNGHIHLSKQAADILGCMEDLLEQDYEALIVSKDLSGYKSCVETVYKSLDTRKSYEYRFQKQGEEIKIKESFYPSYENGVISLYSLIEDVSSEEKMKNDLVQLAYTDPLSKLESELKLMVDLKEVLPSQKFALAIMDVNQFSLYRELYGINFSNQLIYALAQELKKAFEDEFYVSVYHLESDRFAILLKDINDKRSIDALLNKKFALISKNLNLLNHRVQLYFHCGVYRVAKNSTNLDEEKILFYANDAKENLKELPTEPKHRIAHFDSEISKKRFHRNQLITHISESIDHGKIGLSYQQVVRPSEEEIFAYYTQISLDNYEVDESYMKEVIHKRHLEDMMDKYVISTASKELKMLYDEMRAVVSIMIPLSDETMTDSFLAFLDSQNRFYKTTKKGLIFVVSDASMAIVKKMREEGYRIASSDMKDLYHRNIDYFIWDVSVDGMDLLLELSALCEAKNCTLIVGGIQTKEELQSALDRQAKIIYGSYYKKSIRVRKLIEKYRKVS